MVKGEPRIGVFAGKSGIEAGDELTYGNPNETFDLMEIIISHGLKAPRNSYVSVEQRTAEDSSARRKRNRGHLERRLSRIRSCPPKEE